MSQQPLTEAIEHYLRALYKLGAAGEPVSVGALAKAQEVSAASASAMVKKLTALDLVEHPSYGAIALTPAGGRVALAGVRHHPLLELYPPGKPRVSVGDGDDEDDPPGA